MSNPEQDAIETVMKCLVCRKKLDGIIRTLPCLHSAHLVCLKSNVAQQLGSDYDKSDPTCAHCLHPFSVPKTLNGLDDLPVDYFTSSIVSATTVNANINPNDVNCEICEYNPAVSRCQTCQQFYCESCQGMHLKMKTTSSHKFITLDEAFQGGLGVPKIRVLHCHKHSHLEVNSFCKTDETAVCPQCAIEFHKGHDVNLLNDITKGFRDILTSSLNKVKAHQGSLATAIDVIEKTVGEVDKQAEKTKKEINEACDALKKAVEERRGELTKEVEKIQGEKKEELLRQRNQLNVLKTGIHDSSLFTEVLLKEGTETEIAASQKKVMLRLEELNKEKGRSVMEPITEASIGFEGGGGGNGGGAQSQGIKEAIAMIKGIGSVVSRYISVEKSFVELQTTQPLSCSLNQPLTFKVIVVDKKGDRVSTKNKQGSAGTSSIPFSVKVSGNQQVTIEEVQGKDGGEFLVSIVMSVVGKQEISVVYQGKHFRSSPFGVNVVDRPPKMVYRRDYNTVPAKPVVTFGSDGSGDGQFNGAFSVAANTRGEIVVAEYSNHRIQVFDKNGRFLFKFGSSGNRNGQFSSPQGVAIDQRNNQIVVSDYSNHRIQIFDEKGTFLRSFGSQGSGDGQFNGPYGVVVDPQGNFFVAEISGNRVQIFNSNCQFIRKFGSKGNGNGQFSSPCGISILSNGNIVVGDYGNGRLQIFDSQGNFLQVIGSGQTSPYHLFVDSDDNILVGDHDNNRVQIFKADGTLVKTMSGISGPTGVSMDCEGRIIVSDVNTNKIHIF